MEIGPIAWVRHLRQRPERPRGHRNIARPSSSSALVLELSDEALRHLAEEGADPDGHGGGSDDAAATTP